MTSVDPDPQRESVATPPASSESLVRTRPTRGRISYNAGSRLVGRVIGAVITVVALRMATHYFGPSRWGTIVAATALSTLFVGVCDLGISTITSRDLAAEAENADGQRALYGAGLAAVVLVSIPLMVIMVVLDLLIYPGHPEVRTLALILVPMIPLNGLWLVGASVLIAKARNDLRGVIDIATSGYLLVCVAITVAARLHTVPYMWLTVAATAAGSVMAVGFARLYIRADLRKARESIRATLQRSKPVGFSLILASFNSQIDTILLSLFATAAVVGSFGLASQIAVFGVAVPPMLTAAILPKFVSADDARRRVTLQRSFDWLVAGGAALPLFGFLFAKGVINVVGGPRFSAAVVPLILLSCFAALAFPARILLDALIYIGAERRLLGLSIMVTSVNVAVAAVAIPTMHAIGACLAMIASSLAMLAGGWVAFRRAAGYSVSIVFAAKATLISVGLIGAYWIVHLATGRTTSEGLLMIPEAAVVGIVYAGLIVLVGGLVPRGIPRRRPVAG